MRTLTRSIAIASIFGLLLALAPGAAARAAGPSDARQPMLLRGLTLTDQRGPHSTVTLSAELTAADGTPARAEPVVFYEMSSVFGERLEDLGTSMTDATGAASLPFEPTWPGEHTIVARFGGDGESAPAQSTFRFTSDAAAHVHQNAKFGLELPRKYAPFGAALAVLGVWGVLGLVVMRVVRGVMAEAPGDFAIAGVPVARTARQPLTPASISPLLGILGLLTIGAVFVGYVLPSSRSAEPAMSGPSMATGAQQVSVTDRPFEAHVVQTVPGFLTDEEGNLTPNSPNLPADVVQMDGKLFVLDTNLGRILTVTPDGQLARIFESDPDGQRSVARATAMTSHQSELYVAAPLFGNVIEMNAAGRVDTIVQTQLPKAPRPFMPAGIAVTDTGDIWLSDANNARVMLVDSTGSLITTIGYGAQSGGTDEFGAPAGLALDAKGDLWVTDSMRHQVREYSPQGTFVTAVGQDALSMPQDVAIDDFGRVFVTDQSLREVRAFDSKGQFLGSIGLAANAPGGASDAGLQYPHGLEVHGDQLYVMDRLSGMFVYKMGAP